MKLMDKIRSHDARERDASHAQQHAAREPHAHERNPLSTADLAAMDTQPLDERNADATRDDLAHARAARDDVRPIDEPAGKLRDADVEDAVEVARRDDMHGETVATRGEDTRPRAARIPETRGPTPVPRDERLAALFSAEVAQGFRARWDATQIGFVDDPRQAVQQADELVAQVMKNLAQSFADERQQLEAQLHDEKASTENLRVALQRYRSFFQRLLAL